MAKTAETQTFVEVKYIKNNTIYLKDGSLKAVVATSGVNLFLKSEDERNAIIGAFESFLNTVDFPLQIVVQSRRLDISEYIKRLEEVESKQKNNLLRLQTQEYKKFLIQFTSESNIMVKGFFVVIPYYNVSISGSSGGLLEKIFPFMSSNQSNTRNKIEEIRIEEQLSQRVQVVVSGLKHMGMDSYRLNTEDLIRLAYNIYNPGDTEGSHSVIRFS